MMHFYFCGRSEKLNIHFEMETLQVPVQASDVGLCCPLEAGLVR